MTVEHEYQHTLHQEAKLGALRWVAVGGLVVVVVVRGEGRWREKGGGKVVGGARRGREDPNPHPYRNPNPNPNSISIPDLKPQILTLT